MESQSGVKWGGLPYQAPAKPNSPRCKLRKSESSHGTLHVCRQAKSQPTGPTSYSTRWTLITHLTDEKTKERKEITSKSYATDSSAIAATLTGPSDPVGYSMPWRSLSPWRVIPKG